jgi:hypothetical protein
LLRRAYASHRLSVAGPLIPFDAPAAQSAAAFVLHACWFSVSRAEPDAVLERCLTLPAAVATPAQHLSADLLLRFLPQLHRRARAHNPEDRLTTLLAEVLRRWPLSGVLSEVADGPLTATTFGGHPGLLLLYAERLALHAKPAWIPEGPALEYAELVWRELGRDPAALARPGALLGAGRGEAADE